MSSPEHERDLLPSIRVPSSDSGGDDFCQTQEEREIDVILSRGGSETAATTTSGNPLADSMWHSAPPFVSSSFLEPTGPYRARDREDASPQPVSSPNYSSMQSPESARESILSKVGGTVERSSSKILSKVNTGGRIRLGRGENSVRFLEESMSLEIEGGQNAGRRTSHGKLVDGEEEKTDESAGTSGEISADTPLGPPSMPVSPPRRVVARVNERPVRTYREDPVNFHSWEGLKNMVKQASISFADWINRRTLKNIKASLHVLRTYHDAFLYGEVPLHVQTRIRIRTGLIGFLWHILEFLLGVLSAALYIYSTYQAEAKYNWISGLQQGISFAFLADYILRLYTEPSRFYYVLSFWGAVDFLSVIPVILIFRDDIAGVDFIRLLQFVRIMRIFALINKSHVGRSVNQQIIFLSVATFGIIILNAGIIQWIEYNLAPDEYREQCPEAGCFTFWESFYFLIVTVGTVGYGDYAAKTGLGRFVVCVTIIAALIIIPIRVGQITSLAYLSPFGGRGSARKSKGSRFLILSGGISLLAVQNFLAEFYKRTHRQEFEVFPLRVVIMGSHPPSFDLKQVLSHHGKADFIEGCVLRPEDLERVSAHKAIAILLVAYQECNNIQLEDSAQIMRALAVHRFCRLHGKTTHPIRIIVEVLDPATQRSAVWDQKYIGSIEVICPTKIHYKLMARSCFVKGLYTLIANLFTSEIRLKHLDERDFLSEYFNSFDNEIYPVILPSAYYGLPFEEVAEMVLDMFNSTLFALDTPLSSNANLKKQREVLLFPRGQLIRPDDVGLVITNDLNTAFAISRFESKEQAMAIPVGFAESLWKLLRSIMQSGEESLEERGLLRSSTLRVRRNSDGPNSFFRTSPSAVVDNGFGVRNHHVFPQGPDSEFGLETQFRTAIQEVYTQQEYPDWRINPVSSLGDGSQEVGLNEATSSDQEELTPGCEFRFTKGMSLEKAAEELLSWPPVRKTAPPHPAVLEQREQEILDNMRERTLSVVAFNIPHILVCCQLGWPTNFFYFLAELRNPKFANPPVVILYPEEPSYIQWGSVGMFEKVFFLKGSPKYELDLMRGGVIQAARIVVLANQGQPVDLGGSGVMDDRYVNRNAAAYTSDIENIVVAANVQRLYGSKAVEKVIVEMQHANAFHYLRPHYKVPFSQFKRKDYRLNREALIHFGPPFMEGKAMSKGMLGFLMRASFFNRNTVSIVEQLIMGGFVSKKNGLSSNRQRILDHTEVPPACANKTFQKLFTYLLHEKNMLAIGLYRVRGNLGSPTSYVLTNPRKGCIVNPDDLVYIII